MKKLKVTSDTTEYKVNLTEKEELVAEDQDYPFGKPDRNQPIIGLDYRGNDESFMSTSRNNQPNEFYE